MFCRLYEFKLATDLEIIPLQDCGSRCPYYLDDGTCSVCSDKEVSLYKKEKYNWNLTRTIYFPDTELLEDEDTLVGAVKLLHPRYESMWILRWTSLDKEGNESDSYSVIIKSEYKVDDLMMLHWHMKTKCQYENGRPLTKDDFIIKKETSK